MWCAWWLLWEVITIPACAVDRSGQKVQHVQLTNCTWRSGNNARKGLMRCCRRSCCPHQSCCPFAVVATIALNCMVFTSVVVVINYGLVLWWLKLGEVVLPSPHEIEHALLNHIKSIQTSKKLPWQKWLFGEKIIMTNAIFIYAIDVFTPSWFVDWE